MPLKLLKLYSDPTFDDLHLNKYFMTTKGAVFFFKLYSIRYQIENKHLVSVVDDQKGFEFIVFKTLK